MDTLKCFSFVLLNVSNYCIEKQNYCFDTQFPSSYNLNKKENILFFPLYWMTWNNINRSEEKWVQFTKEVRTMFFIHIFPYCIQ